MIDILNQKMKSLQPQVDAIDWHSLPAYAEWLSQSYYIVRRSTPYLGLCMFHAHDFPEFQDRCADHIQEERGHEKLILKDLKQLSAEMTPELASTPPVYQPQYFQIVAGEATNFLGYVFFLELLAPAYGVHMVKDIPYKKALSFLTVHTRSDEDHVESAMKVLEKLSPAQREKVIKNFDASILSYGVMLEEIAERHCGVRRKLLKNAA